ncbi:MAG: hypothetical protein M9928_15560 [Anaerolineae bacterium]|nr:hypothetical protein [Anaerolineae bacterium]MCO5194570.1 hypothetical protein [Anaerolineae bacterium]MCO5199644.1 hypothetical protein [Anaerolineae bacterium]MCO5206453.1 hypothetical protein [Anaerolineae bacterium]
MEDVWKPRTGQALVHIGAYAEWRQVIERVRPIAGSKFMQVEIVGTGRHTLIEKNDFRPRREAIK